MSARVGVDIGGTFTDFALMDEQSADAWAHKALTTPDDPSRAVVEGLQDLLSARRMGFDELAVLAHGTTLVTNAVIERRGAAVGMLVTRGFADAIDIARETRYDLFDLRLKFAEPVAPRERRVEIAERTSSDGSVTQGIDDKEVLAAVRQLVELHNVQSVAICFLNSFRNPANEQRTAALIRQSFPELFVSMSSAVANSIKEYERWTTTLINAYTQPLIDVYLTRLEESLKALGFSGVIRIMTSSGGSFDTALARELPVRLIESGPAAGVLMAAELARSEGLDEILAFDMGGTTAKGAFVRDARPIRKYEMEVAREHHFRPGSGLPIRVPVIDLIEIGSGGGSIAHVDGRGLVGVGPRSASAKPGPACYGLGGDSPTLTDANLVLGYLDADYFLGGQMRLRSDSAMAALESIRAKIGGRDIEPIASGVREIAAEDVAAAFRTHAAELGLDVRRSTLVAFGGSGPLIATLVARKLRITEVLFPAGSGIFSAIGLLASAASFEASRSLRMTLSRGADDRMAATLEVLRAEAKRALSGMGVPADCIDFQEILDLRYEGQGYQLRIDLPARPAADEWVEQVRKRFEDAYASTFSTNAPDAEIEVTDWRVVAIERQSAEISKAVVRPLRGNDRTQDESAEIWLSGRRMPCRKVSRYTLRPGDTVYGPALIQEVESTCVLLPGDRGSVTARGHIRVNVASG